MKTIPLHDRDGRVRAEAMVDDEDYFALRGYRWHLNNNSYAVRCEWFAGSVRAFLMHREVLGLVHGDGLETDHINREKLDNRRANLRVGTHAENLQNRNSHRGSTSCFRGVWWSTDKQRWRVRPGVNGSYTHVGYFRSELEAARAAEAFRRKHMPFAEPDPVLLAAEQTATEREAA